MIGAGLRPAERRAEAAGRQLLVQTGKSSDMRSGAISGALA